MKEWCRLCAVGLSAGLFATCTADGDGSTGSSDCTRPDCVDRDCDGYGDGVDCVDPDCDDWDPNAQVAGTDLGCNFAGVCFNDGDGGAAGWDDGGYGVGACAGIDCNPADAAVSAPLVPDGLTPCNLATATLDCDPNVVVGAYGLCSGDGGTCLVDNVVCGHTGTGTCPEAMSCIAACAAGDAVCLQGCIEAADPLGQWLYERMQTCAAVAGCFGESDPASCALVRCTTDVDACNADIP